MLASHKFSQKKSLPSYFRFSFKIRRNRLKSRLSRTLNLMSRSFYLYFLRWVLQVFFLRFFFFFDDLDEFEELEELLSSRRLFNV